MPVTLVARQRVQAVSNTPFPQITAPMPMYPPADGWISIESPSQQSADIVNHEYGHVVMANLWTNYSPNWPPFDCPSSHFIGIVSGPGCALFEGFANFWAWYSNEFYDGDDSTANDGPVFNWPSGASTNVETRDGGSYQAGDQVEGNIAAVFGDMYDITNDGPLQGPADRLSDGIQHIWRTTFSQSDNNFSEWWNAYWSTSNLNPCPAFQILQFNTIPYTLNQCTQSPQTCAFSCETSFLPGCLGPGWGAVGGLTPSAPHAALDAAGRVRLFVRGVDNGIWQNRDCGGGFQGWSTVGGLTPSAPAAVVDAAGHVRLFARGVDDSIWQNIDSGNGFTGWAPLGGLTHTPVASALDDNDELHLFARGVDERVWENVLPAGASCGWMGWQPIRAGGQTPSGPAAVADVSGVVRLFVQSIDAGIYEVDSQ
jgi:hypothetical protein